MNKSTKYLIVFSCMLLQAVPYGIAQNIPPLFIQPLISTFHFTLESVGYIFTIGAVAASLSAPFTGVLYKKYSVKIIMFLGLILSGLGVMMNALANELSTFLIAAAITQIGTIAFSGLGIPYLMGTWFENKEKAQALGIAFAGGSIGNFFLQPLVTHLLQIYSVHKVYFIMGLASVIVGSVIILGFIKQNKQSANITKEPEKNTENNIIIQKGIGYKNTLKLKEFWVFSCFYALVGLSVAALSVQYAKYFSYLKIDPYIIGIIGSTFAVSCLIGNLMGGVLFARLGVFKTMLIAFVLQLIAIISLYLGLVNTTVVVISAFGWAVFYGLNVYSYTSAPAIMIQNLFGMKESSQTLGTFSIFFAVGFAIGNIIFGVLVDKFGYFAGWSSILIYTLIGFIGLLSSIRLLEPRNYATADE